MMVGSINGVICLLSHLREVNGQFVALWNPSINMWKPIRLPGPEFLFDSNREGCVGYVSTVGLGFVPEEDDYRIVRIVLIHRVPKSWECWSRVEVYSVNSDSWTYVDNEDCIPFWPNLPNSSFILKGVPYFVGVD
ncbi:hypothetical protein POM88_028733 [Heracleum sosnowskyi]|uniref:F-box associated beta-propeller type 1 domain-containing protein n=1 Tax=Heracleum sosnowskyi TaxID=360622 RepID=A0AAD8MEA0_9APIA|nr:hypothetical protein POM88_028733 [Heracleum sosnowskyi]